MFLILIFLFSIIQTLTPSERIYDELKAQAKYEIANYNSLFFNESKKGNFVFDASTILTIFEIAETIYSSKITKDIINAIFQHKKYGYKKLPKNYNFIEKYRELSFPISLSMCEPSSAYAAALAASYRIYKKNETIHLLSPIPIMEFFGQCKKINVIDAFYYIKQYGLLDFNCRFSYRNIEYEKIEYDDCISYDRYRNVVKSKTTTYKSKEAYSIKGKKNIKKEIMKYGPVTTTFKYYEDFLYYKNGYYDHVVGEELGEFSAVIVGWDKEGWIAQSSLGDAWGNEGFFKVKYENNIEFGEIAYAMGSFVFFNIYFFFIFLFINLF